MMNPAVDHYLAAGCGRCPKGGTPECKVHNWTEALKQLRRVILECGLKEERKWGVPCYTYKGKNVLVMSALVQFCSIGFFKGSLLEDPHQLLSRPGENSQAVRQLCFTTAQQVLEAEPQIKEYIQQAIEVEKSGQKVDFKAKHELVFPEELTQKLAENPELQKAFNSLTPGRQRGYILHFTSPKKSATRHSRIDKCAQKIFAGKGLHD